MLSSQKNLSSFERQKSQIEPHLMLFSPWCYGHYPSYLRHLIVYWCQFYSAVTLSIVVSPDFLKEHEEVIALRNNCIGKMIQFVTLTQEEQRQLELKTSSWSRAFWQHQLVAKYANQLKATTVLYMYFDSCQLPLVMGLKLPCTFSGIYFRPTFHYNHFLNNYVPTWKEQLQQLKEKIFLRRLLTNSQLQTLFCLDLNAVTSINKLTKQIKAVGLADPITVEKFADGQIKEFKQNLGIEANRKVLLSFGRLTDTRKGISQLIEAVSFLPNKLCKKICLLFAGEPNGLGEEILESWLASIRQKLPIQIITRYGYVPESEVQLYFQLSDLVLAPYQKHLGMSGILLQAAAAQKPVLSSDYGLMGELVRGYCLGLTVDSTKPDCLAKGLTKFLLESVEEFYNRDLLKKFTEQNSAEKFAKTIFEYTLKNTNYYAQAKSNNPER